MRAFRNNPSHILIVKTSSLGDIVQSFSVLNYLMRRFPNAKIDWAVEKRFEGIVAAHPLISRSISLDMKGMKSGWRRLSNWRMFWQALRDLRKEKYDLIFDLQGNCKSGFVTIFSRGGTKIGFGRHSVREWPNIFATHLRFEVPKQINIRLQHLRLIQQFFKDTSPVEVDGVRFKIEESEKEHLQRLLNHPALQTSLRIMVCPGSKWINKQLPLETLCQLLKRIRGQLGASFLLMWGEENEKVLCEEIHLRLSSESLIVEKLPIPTWQNLMNEVDLVLAVDSSALHLCGTTSTPSFSVFGPTSPDIFKPIGHRHYAFQGKCPYNRSFEKTCPILRTCPTGSCIRGLSAEEIYLAFIRWWQKLEGSQKSERKGPPKKHLFWGNRTQK